MPIDIKKVTGRRSLRFNSLDAIVADLDALEGKPLRSLGNWSVGQNLQHLAIVMNGAIDGLRFRAPWYIRALVGLFKRRMLTKPMPAGFQLPKAAAAVMVPGAVGEAEGFAALRGALGRLRAEMHREPSPVLGQLTIEEWNQLQCRHCELHLSFIVLQA